MAKTHYPKKRRSAAQRALAIRNLTLIHARRRNKNSEDAVAAATPDSSSTEDRNAAAPSVQEDSDEEYLEKQANVPRPLREAKQQLAAERQRSQTFQRKLRNTRTREKRLRVAVANLRDKLKEARMERQMEAAVAEARLREVEADARTAVAEANDRSRAWEAWAREAYVAGAQAEAHALRTRLVQFTHEQAAGGTMGRIPALVYVPQGHIP
ncbi:hypothetical protein C8Q70DRAFT_998541 [Cubamyces menziesii]|nr:hypothetical protein C8Q70DRAFT_998541 [Cubamyces menziesii]